MAFKNLLVHIDDGKACTDRIQAAITLARAHEAHLTGLYVAAEPSLLGDIGVEIPARTEFLAALKDQLAERTEAAKARFIGVVERAGLSAECHWADWTGMGIAEVIGLHARYTDLVVLGQPDESREPENHITEDVVLSSGRPALVVPYIGAGKTIGERVMVAWDAGREAARAVHDALPVLERAKSVVVLVINPRRGDHGAEPGADIALHLARHGIKVEAQHLEAKGLSVADTLLSRLADQGIDLLVMGAYGHSRLRELVLGGVTRQLFQQMTVPVLMSH
jgi:nucleotide-binding universal stress UspA family protein